MGTVTNEKIQAVLNRYHILVLLSDYEGTPGAVMDGMASGLVPVCLDISGGVQELIIHENTGLLVKDRGQSFVDAIARLATDTSLRKRLAANAKEHMAKHFSLNVAADRWRLSAASLSRREPSFSSCYTQEICITTGKTRTRPRRSPHGSVSYPGDQSIKSPA